MWRVLLILAACVPTHDVVQDLFNTVNVVVDYPVHHLRVPEHLIALDAEAQARVDREAAELQAIYGSGTGAPQWSGPWQLPVDSKVTGLFGTRRIMNGKPAPTHNGVDQRGKPGTPVAAAASGRVAYVGTQLIRGNVVVLDHGGGVFTTYAHFHEVRVAVGDRIERGQVIGTIGKTGRITAPHLHWEVHICGVAVDPIRVVEATQAPRS